MWPFMPKIPIVLVECGPVYRKCGTLYRQLYNKCGSLFINSITLNDT